MRPIHYMGNKSRYLKAIEEAVDGVAPPGRAACDLFAGTSVVSRRLARKRPVLSADVQMYSQVLARALTHPTRFSASDGEAILAAAEAWLSQMRRDTRDLLEYETRALENAPRDPAALAQLIEAGSFAFKDQLDPDLVRAKARAANSLTPTSATLTWYYGGAYFSYAQALTLDALRYAARTVGGRDDTVVAAIMGAASDAVSTVGNHFAQPVQPRGRDGSIKRNWIASVARRRDYSILLGFAEWLARYGRLTPVAHQVRSIQADFRSTLSTMGPDIGVIYADPPYTRDHYSRFYHVLETIALDDDPGVTRSAGSTQPSRGLYRKSRHQSPFSIRSQAAHAFEFLFSRAGALGVPVVLSYSPMSDGTRARPETRLMSIDELAGVAASHFRFVDIVPIEESTHSMFNRAEVSVQTSGAAEVVLVAKN
ncbi:DNA adenine methylase [Demequina sp. SYSU T00068]|uniref:DNA adenine methylase n=1 Tax=Demequina lignilytica TaxID=3051663 RepID=UPI002604F0AA|nr:DNA adenine methylase [Demequina sp. SYSU T00068]MDN4491047.1 DNA adenine methylase [Demequina sp. SYSU T00068]